MAEFFVQLPHVYRYGPYSYPEDKDIASDLLKLSEASEPLIAGTHYRVKLPKNLREYILVAVYPFSGADRPPFSPYGEETVAEPVIVYGVRCGPNERLSEEEIRNRLQTTNEGRDVIGERYFCVAVDSDQERDEEDDLFSSKKYGRGTILVAKSINSNSDSYTPPSVGNLPPLPLYDDRQGHASITATSDHYESNAFVTPNQNQVVPETQIMRKIESTLDDPTQALMADLPHLEQKPPLRNLGDLAGGTTTHSVLVTPSTEQAAIPGGPLPCRDKPPTVVIKVTSEGDSKGEGEEERRNEIVRPESESSRSVSSPIPNGGSLLSCYRRQGSLSSGEDMVAPKFQVSHVGMVTGRTLSLPPNSQQNQSEKDGIKVENIPIVSGSSLLRTHSDLSTVLLRKNSDSNLLLNCNNLHVPIDDGTNEQGQKSTRRRRRSMSDVGVQRQDSGGDLNEAVIAGAGASKLVNANRKAPHVSTTIHEHSAKEDSKITEEQEHIDVQTSVADLSDDLCSRHDELQEEPCPLEIRPTFHIGSLNQSSSLEDPTAGDEEDKSIKQHKIEHMSGILLDVQYQGERVDGNLSLVEKTLTRGTGQQVHIMEHVYNGNCVLKDDCPEPPSPEKLRQMSSIVDAHRNGSVNSLTEWLKELIRTHCSRCRDAGCRVPHMAVGCPPPGAAQYSSSSSGSPICSTPPRSPPPSSPSPSSPLSLDQMHCGPPRGIPTVSIDRSVQKSTTSQVMEYYRDDHAPAESAHHLEQRGTNYADYPHTHFSREFPKTHATPPDEENPMIFAGPTAHYGSRMFPGNRHGCGFAPVAATTNEDPYQPMGYQRPRMPGSHITSHMTGRMTHAPPRTPIQQESAYEIAGVPDRRQTCYIQPSRKVNLQEQSRDLSDPELPDIRTGGFPHSSRYAKVDEGVLIYCSERLYDLTGFVLGTTCCLPNQQKADILGHGGNGRVYSYYQNGEIFALKRTTYRQCELQSWFQLDHPNVLPLLGVMWGGAGGHSCYQLMPRMTSDLSSVMRSVGDLCTLVSDGSGDQWEKVVRHNVRHVVKGLVEGVRYLHDQGIQHYDLKAGNILINKRESCHCPNIFKCNCPLASKCEIRIADFDSIKTFTPGRSATLVPDSPSEPKPAGVKVLGTPFYRAPEQFKQYSKDALREMPCSQQQHGLEGPWCDMWSVGVILTQLCLGKDRAKERKIVCNTMVTSATTNTTSGHPTPEVEGLVARERLSTLREKCINCYQLAPLADIAMLCLEPDFKKRVTADKLLKNNFFCK